MNIYIIMVMEIISYQIAISEKNRSGKIIAGFTCHPRDYPYLIALTAGSDSIFCGGSLLNNYHVLTAAHCCRHAVDYDIVVHAGLSTQKQYIQSATAPIRIVHPVDDICVLELDTPISETPYTKFARLCTRKEFKALMDEGGWKECITLGFGKQSKTFENGSSEQLTPNPKLQCVFQDILSEKRCRSRKVLCVVGSHELEQDACAGDSGGPLICRGTQVAFVMSGIGCGLGLPSYYYRIDAGYSFIMLHSTDGFSIRIISSGDILIYCIIVIKYIT